MGAPRPDGGRPGLGGTRDSRVNEALFLKMSQGGDIGIRPGQGNHIAGFGGPLEPRGQVLGLARSSGRGDGCLQMEVGSVGHRPDDRDARRGDRSQHENEPISSRK